MNPSKMRFGIFIWLVLLLVGLGILRSAIATRLDGFTIDEAYHIAAGVSYVRYADFRINPEHPPLVKLWVGSLISTMISIQRSDAHGSQCGCLMVCYWSRSDLQCAGPLALAWRSELCSFSPLIRLWQRICPW